MHAPLHHTAGGRGREEEKAALSSSPREQSEGSVRYHSARSAPRAFAVCRASPQSRIGQGVCNGICVLWFACNLETALLACYHPFARAADHRHHRQATTTAQA
eukprot:scaffold8968_cov57-Phaeocystis_antarctica.AAC.4